MAEKVDRGIGVLTLRYWRREKGLTQDELAVKAGVGSSTVVRGEHGEPVSSRNARKVATALGVEYGQLLHEDRDTK